MAILIDNQQKRYRIALERMRQKAKVILDALASPDAELSILIVDDTRMEELNRTYLGRSGTTNVISFPMQEGDFSHISPHLLGDVVISADTAHREAQDARISIEERLTQLLIHGVLHLVGYDHEKDGADAAGMEKKERELAELCRDVVSKTGSKKFY